MIRKTLIIFLFFYLSLKVFSLDTFFTIGDFGLGSYGEEPFFIMGVPEVWLSWGNGIGLAFDPYKINLSLNNDGIRHEFCETSLFWSSPGFMNDTSLLGPKVSIDILSDDDRFIFYNTVVGFFFNWGNPLSLDHTPIPFSFRIMYLEAEYNLANENFALSFSLDFSIAVFSAIEILKNTFHENTPYFSN